MTSLPKAVRDKIKAIAGVHPSFNPTIRVQRGSKPPVDLWPDHYRIEVGADWICDQPELVAFILSEELQR
jgi:hypothetical protein